MQADPLWQHRWDATPTHVPAPDGSGVLHETPHGSTTSLALLGPGGRVVEQLPSIPHPAGGQVTFSVANARYVAFAYSLTNGQAAAWRWALYLFDRRTKQITRVAQNPVDSHGQPRQGGWVRPVLTARYLYWITAAKTVPSGWGGSALEQYELATGRTRTLYRGLTEAFVPYGSMVLYTGLVAHPPGVDTNTGQGAPETVYAVDQVTGRAVPPPAGITAGRDGAAEMQTDGDVIVWNAALGALRAWRPAWHRSITLVPQNWEAGMKQGWGPPANPRIFDRFVISQPGPEFVYDLTTNSLARLTSAADSVVADVSGPYLSLALSRTPTGVAHQRGEQEWDQYLVDLRGLPRLPRCG